MEKGQGSAELLRAYTLHAHMKDRSEEARSEVDCGKGLCEDELEEGVAHIWVPGSKGHLGGNQGGHVLAADVVR